MNLSIKKIAINISEGSNISDGIISVGNIWKHIKTGGQYRILYTEPLLQIEDPKWDMTNCIIYQSMKDNRVWVRPKTEFLERFEFISE